MSLHSNDTFFHQRQLMVEKQLRGRDIVDLRVLEVMGEVPRHEFVPEKHRAESYVDNPLPIRHGQTISQPYIVALMIQLAQLEPESRVLEIGTGCGYQTAILSQLAALVFSVEIVESLSATAEVTLRRLNYHNIALKSGDGYQGWEENAPYDAIIVAAAPTHVPKPLIDQLKLGGRLIIPVGGNDQDLLQIVRQGTGTMMRTVVPVRFVPMTGEADRH